MTKNMAVGRQRALANIRSELVVIGALFTTDSHHRLLLRILFLFFFIIIYFFILETKILVQEIVSISLQLHPKVYCVIYSSWSTVYWSISDEAKNAECWKFKLIAIF